MHNRSVHLPCNRCSYSFFSFSCQWQAVICSLYNVHMHTHTHTNDCIIASFFFFAPKLKEKRTVVRICRAHLIYIVRVLCTFGFSCDNKNTNAIGCSYARWTMIESTYGGQNAHIIKTRCSNINGSRCTIQKTPCILLPKTCPNLWHCFKSSIQFLGIISVLFDTLMWNDASQLFWCVTKRHSN